MMRRLQKIMTFMSDDLIPLNVTTINNSRKTIIKQILNFFLCSCLFLIPALNRAAEVPEHQVRSAVENWMRHVTADPKLDTVIEKLEPYRIDDKTVAYIAHIDGIPDKSIASKPDYHKQFQATTGISTQYVEQITQACPSKSSDESAVDFKDSSGMVEPKVAVELPNGAAERAYFLYTDAEVAKSSYTAVDVNGCSGTLIGPNTMMTAGHCNQNPRNAVVKLYTSSTVIMTETFACEYLLHTWPDTDLNLYWCAANGAGENPGDKYGYMDFDIDINPDTGGFSGVEYASSRLRLMMGAKTYSIWQNPVTALGVGWYALYSKGEIDNTEYSSWYTPNTVATDYLCGNNGCVGGNTPGHNCEGTACGPACDGGSCDARLSREVAVHTDLWSMGGASGSSQLGMNSNRILIGPLSVGSNDAPGRSSLPMADIVYWAITDANVSDSDCVSSCTVNQVNEPLLTTLGLSGTAAYFGYVDDDIDGRFDVQHALELLVGETRRDWYWLGFESHRRNGLWTPHAAANPLFYIADPDDSYVTLDTRSLGSDAYTLALSHERLNLQGGRLYHLQFNATVTDAAYQDVLQICLDGVERHCTDFDSTLGISQSHVVNLWSSDNATLQIYLKNGSRVLLQDVSIIAEGQAMNFDSHDQRYSWRNLNTGARGLVWPNGVNSGSQADWAGAVFRSVGMPLTEDWSLGNDQLAIDAGAEYRVCFDVALSARESWTAGMLGAVGLFDNSGAVTGSLGLFGLPASNWANYCSLWVPVNTDNVGVRFGVSASSQGDQGTYLVDNIRVEKRPPSVIYVDGQFTGTEYGTSSNPYSLVEEGVNNVALQGTVMIKTGSYPEPLVIQRGVTLEAQDGPVVIGQ